MAKKKRAIKEFTFEFSILPLKLYIKIVFGAKALSYLAIIPRKNEKRYKNQNKIQTWLERVK